MDGKGRNVESEQAQFESAGLAAGAEGATPEPVRPGPTWRAWLISLVAAIVLSVAATLLLGGSFRLPGASNAAAGGSGAGAAGPCCPPRGDPGK